MLEVTAIAPRDGWAFVRDGGHIWLVRPPYTRATRAEVSEDAIGRAVSDHGFVVSDETFPSWAGVVAFLEDQTVSAAGAALEDSERLRRLLAHAPLDVIQGYLTRIASELIPQGEYAAALALLAELLELDSVKNRRDLLDGATTLNADCRHALARASAARAGLARDEELLSRQLPHVVRALGLEPVDALAREIDRRHQVLPVGAR